MIWPMPPLSELDRLVARAQRGDVDALDAVCARARPMLVRHARRFVHRPADVDDVVQDALLIVARRIHTYRWEGSFASWLYATSTRAMLRSRRVDDALELTEAALVSDHELMSDAEWSFIEQDLHLSCTLAVLTGLDAEARRLYLLGEVLVVPDRVGAQVAGITPAAYRKRLERARRAVAAQVRDGGAAAHASLARAAEELDALVRLGELHRAHARPAQADGALRALALAAPTLLAA
jgi:RNA polymerase sigma factor (sigma-70 family)